MNWCRIHRPWSLHCGHKIQQCHDAGFRSTELVSYLLTPFQPFILFQYSIWLVYNKIGICIRRASVAGADIKNPFTINQELPKIPSVRPGVCQSMVSHASPTATNTACLVSAFLVHLTSFFPSNIEWCGSWITNQTFTFDEFCFNLTWSLRLTASNIKHLTSS